MFAVSIEHRDRKLVKRDEHDNNSEMAKSSKETV